jgi:dCTP deaminase
MSLLSYTELVELVNQDVITADYSRINGSSIDITLDSVIRAEVFWDAGNVDLAKKENIHTHEIQIDEYYLLEPGEFILASSHEIFNLPNDISCEYKLKSSMARNGLEHLNAGWCDAGWTNSKLTLELKNMTSSHPLILRPGMAIGQIVFFRHKPVPKDKSYAVTGQYNNQSKVQSSKGIR